MTRAAYQTRPSTQRGPDAPQPFDWARFQQGLVIHLARWHLAYCLMALAAFAFHIRYTIGINVTTSLPSHVFLIDKGVHPTRGEYVAFRWPGGGPYAAGMTFVKIIAGVAGDTVLRNDRAYFVNRQSVGEAKPRSRDGERLAPGPTGTLPPGRYYVYTPHPDSLDSRYALVGWISESQILGRAYALF